MPRVSVTSAAASSGSGSRRGHVSLSHLVVLGASIEEALFGTSGERSSFQSEVLTLTGKPITVHDYATSGWTTQNLLDSMPATTAALAHLPKDGSTYAMIHIGGNDVTANRPYTSAQDPTVIASMIAGINAIIDHCEAAGWRWVLCDLTFRNYDGTTYGQPSAEEGGALPYNRLVTQAINRARGSKYVHPDGRSWFDLYTLLWNNVSWLQSDGIHILGGSEGAFRSALAQMVKPLVDGSVPQPLTKAPAPSFSFDVGETILVSFGTTGKTVAADTNPVLVVSQSNMTAGTVYSGNLKEKAGQTLTGVSLVSVRPFASFNNAGNSALSLAPHISGAMMSQSLFVGTSPPSGPTADDAAVKFVGLPAGTYDIVAAGSRNVASDGKRTTNVAVEVGTGSVLSGSYNAANPASGGEAPNCVFTAVSPVGGEIQLRVQRPVTNDTTYFGYLGALAITRVS